MKSGPSYDQNLCVWDGFACGINIVIPATGFSNSNQLAGESGSCLSNGPPGTAPEWAFIDSRRCADYHSASRFFIAVYRQQCPILLSSCQDNFGFFEVVDAGPIESFDNFKTNVTAANPAGFISTPALIKLNGTYHSARGQTIEFQADSGDRNAGITAVNGMAQNDVDSWTFAEGSTALPAKVITPILSAGDGHVIIWNPRYTSRRLDLDFRNYQHPVRTVK